MRTLSTRSGARLLLLAGLCLAVAIGQLATLDMAWASGKGEKPGKSSASKAGKWDDRDDRGKADPRQGVKNSKGRKSIKSSRSSRHTHDQDRKCHPGCDGLRLTGAIFTTNAEGTLVNGNLYAAPADVFLGGGPAIARHARHGFITAANKPEEDDDEDGERTGRMPAGLPDGRYYFQVTDPGGKTLLSVPATAVQNRQFEVVNGYIQAVLGSHLAISLEEPFPLDYTIVQLSPFAPTPNRGREYKVWVTPVEKYAPGTGVFGFRPECSKTDNFKLRRSSGGGGGGGTLSAILTGTTFLDVDLDGIWEPMADPLEPAQPNVQINVYAAGNPEPVAFGYTGTLGQYSFQLTPTALPATYTVGPVIPSLELQGDLKFAPTTPPTRTVTITASGQLLEGLDFGLIRVGDSGANIRFSPAFFLGGVGSQGQLVLADLADSGDPWQSAVSAIAAAPILGAGCVTAPVEASAFEFTRVLAGNYTAPPALPANPACQLIAYWLSLSLTVAADGLPTDHASGGEVSTVTGAEQIYVGLDPVSGAPVYMTLEALLQYVGANYNLLTPEYLAFYLTGLQQAADNFSFVQATAGDGGGGGGGDL